MTNHRDCDHEATKAARARCRKERDEARIAEEVARHGLLLKAKELIEVLGADWVKKGAIAFTDFTYADSQAPGADLEAAKALLAYFAPSGDEDTDRRRRANGYTITTSPSEIRRIILRRFS